MAKPKAVIEFVDGVCTESGVGYEVIAPKGYSFGFAEHIRLVDTKREAASMAKNLQPCECSDCTEGGR